MTTPLVGRDNELARADQVLAAIDPAGNLLLVAGEAGMGKTAFCETLLAHGAAAGFDVAWSACWEASARASLAPWADVLDQLGIDRAALIDPLSPVDVDAAADQRERRFGDVIGALRERTRRQRVLIVIDDIHWADPATLRLLFAVAPIS